MTESLHLTLLGGWDLTGADRAPMPVSQQTQRLVALVALSRRPSREYVAGTLWPEESEHHAHSSLRTLLFRLRRRDELGGLLSITESSIALAREVTVDVDQVAACASALVAGRTCASTPDPMSLLTQGDLLPGWYDDWVHPQRERLRQLRLHALEAVAEGCRDQGRPAEALDAALAAVHIEPLRESSNRVVVGVHLQEGNVVEALRHYHYFERLLHDELRIPPTTLMTDLVRPFLATGGRRSHAALTPA
ncbi:BTAD domain-containing putative transcriptional regulator [Nocardioides sp.]|uniref:AfsR/SARP family transcriptional regulator n=1 Tax=Nocardioides sp. TaxID=35761 RepID=UPI00272299DC|nr:BTAD domain-containing putative transcriptional regulator [Nocardioides sp.]MDO9454527.1 BTAD domain-containing putative transcriptional regulator [Nocardioides sp.]